MTCCQKTAMVAANFNGLDIMKKKIKAVAFCGVLMFMEFSYASTLSEDNTSSQVISHKQIMKISELDPIVEATINNLDIPGTLE